MIERMGENDRIVTRYMSDKEFQGSAFPVLAREIFETVRARRGDGVQGAHPAMRTCERSAYRPMQSIRSAVMPAQDHQAPVLQPVEARSAVGGTRRSGPGMDDVGPVDGTPLGG